MARKKRTALELKRASDHLRYEIAMFIHTASALGTGWFGREVIHNALLESFVIHARALVYFFYPANPQPDDVVVNDFFEDDSTWENAVPPMSHSIELIRPRTAKEVAHLTYARLNVTEETKGWNFSEISADLQKVIERFERLVPLALLGNRWNHLRPVTHT